MALKIFQIHVSGKKSLSSVSWLVGVSAEGGGGCAVGAIALNITIMCEYTLFKHTQLCVNIVHIIVLYITYNISHIILLLLLYSNIHNYVGI